jgi:hypothetical protein
MKLITTILILILIYYYFSRYIAPFLIRKIIKKAQKKYGADFKTNRPEGEINVDYVPPESKKQKYTPDSVEDVDFEEVKDK